MNTALTIYGLSFIYSPISTTYRTWEAGSMLYHVMKFTVNGVVYLFTPSPPPIEEDWDDLSELTSNSPSLYKPPRCEHDASQVESTSGDTSTSPPQKES